MKTGSWIVRRALLVALLFAIATACASAEEKPKRVLVFGDSISWGWTPVKNGAPTQRLARDVRWPGVMRQRLGSKYRVIVNAVSGRTTDLDDPTFPGLTGAGLNGLKALPEVIAAHLPLDLVILFLGTNDLKAHFKRSALRIALGAGRLVALVKDSGQMFGSGWYRYPAPRVLLVAPPALGKQKVS